MHQKAPILKSHLAILEQVVDDGQQVALGLLEAFEHEQAAPQRRFHHRLIDILDRAAAHQLAPLLEVRLSGVSADGDDLDLALGQLGEPENELPQRSRMAPEQHRILPQRLLLHEPLNDLESVLAIGVGDATQARRARHERRQSAYGRELHVADAHGAGTQEAARGRAEPRRHA